MACGCSKLRLGGTTLDGIYALHPFSWDGLWGWPGRRGDNPPVIGRSGSYRVPSKEAAERIATVGIQIRRRDTAGAVTLPFGECEHLEFNQDTILGLLGSEDLLTLEWDRANGTSRYLEVECLDAAPINFEGDEQRVSCVFRAPYPQWRLSGTAIVANITGGPINLNPGGNAPVEDAILSFSADGEISNSLTGDAVGVDAPSYAQPVLINLATGEVTQNGVRVSQYVTAPDTARIFHLRPNVNNPLTASAGTIGVTYRPQWW